MEKIRWNFPSRTHQIRMVPKGPTINTSNQTNGKLVCNKCIACYEISSHINYLLVTGDAFIIHGSAIYF